mmetsp:Transcript_1982/g.5992  ORF Transcript_1982/g.5992 Transcript_1982/m.5992 type:complete len:219 (+) Transcript_1982:625-1281(+)
MRRVCFILTSIRGIEIMETHSLGPPRFSFHLICDQLLLVNLSILKVKTQLLAEFLHHKLLLWLAEHNRGPLSPSSRRPPCSMNVVVRIGGEVKADNVAEAGDIDPSRCDLSRHHQRHLPERPLAQSSHHLLSVLLGLIALEGGSDQAVLEELVANDVYPPLIVDEDKQPCHTVEVEDLLHQRDLLHAGGHNYTMSELGGEPEPCKVQQERLLPEARLR